MTLDLNNFFHPLTFFELVKFFVCFVALDSIGFYIAKKLFCEIEFLRPIYWLFGLGIWVFCWFGLHFWFPFVATKIWLSLIFLSIPTWRFYIREQGLMGYFKFLKQYPLMLILVLPLLPIVWVKVSMPPYFFDEMAYQYYSPRNYLDLPTWDFFQGGLYQNLPRLLNTAYYLMFGISNSYALARLLHFSIFVSTFWSIHLWISKRFGDLPAIFFLALYLYLPIDILTTSTLGYVDIAAVSLITLATLLTIDNLIYKSKSLIPALLIWSLALGIKYTSSVTLLAVGIFWFIGILIQKRNLFKFDRKKWLVVFAICIAMGGYWYIKNLALFWSPIYPFVLPCKPGLIEKCNTSNSFFAGWTVPINIENAREILSQLFAGQIKLVWFYLAACLLLVANIKKKSARVGLSILGVTIIEFAILKHLSGFYLRYNQHLQVLSIILICLPVISLKNKNLSSIVSVLFSLLLGILILIGGYKTLRYHYYLPGYIQKYELDYSLGKSNIWDWLDKKFTKTNTVIKYCNEVQEQVTLTNVDPDLIWFEYEGMMRVFLTNCIYRDNPLGAYKIEDLGNKAKEHKVEVLFPSINPCVSEDKIRRLPYENENQKHLRKVNNWMVCNSKEVVPYLYRFTYKDLQK